MEKKKQGETTKTNEIQIIVNDQLRIKYKYCLYTIYIYTHVIYINYKDFSDDKKIR